MANINPTELRRLALNLPESDRLVLAAVLLGSVEPLPSPEVEEAWEAEIAARVSQFEEGQVQGISSAEVHRRAHAGECTWPMPTK